MPLDLDGLVERLLQDVALTGTHGMGFKDLTKIVEKHHNQSTNQASTTPADPVFSYAPNVQGSPDSALVKGVWDYLSKQPDTEARIVPNPEWDIEEGDIAQALSGDGQDSPSLADDSGPKQWRLFASKDRMWHVITGHGVDYKRVTMMEFDCLSVIAAHGPAGVTQPVVRRLTGQDKRSVPKRTDFLAEKGYITKQGVVAKTATSLLILKRYAEDNRNNAQTLQESSDVIDNNAWFLKMLDLFKQHQGVIALQDLRIHLGVHGKENHQGTKLLMSCIRRLEGNGCLRKCTAQAQNLEGELKETTAARCIQLLREPTELDRLVWTRRATGKKIYENAVREHLRQIGDAHASGAAQAESGADDPMDSEAEDENATVDLINAEEHIGPSLASTNPIDLNEHGFPKQQARSLDAPSGLAAPADDAVTPAVSNEDDPPRPRLTYASTKGTGGRKPRKQKITTTVGPVSSEPPTESLELQERDTNAEPSLPPATPDMTTQSDGIDTPLTQAEQKKLRERKYNEANETIFKAWARATAERLVKSAQTAPQTSGATASPKRRRESVDDEADDPPASPKRARLTPETADDASPQSGNKRSRGLELDSDTIATPAKRLRSESVDNDAAVPPQCDIEKLAEALYNKRRPGIYINTPQALASKVRSQPSKPGPRKKALIAIVKTGRLNGLPWFQQGSPHVPATSIGEQTASIQFPRSPGGRPKRVTTIMPHTPLVNWKLPADHGFSRINAAKYAPSPTSPMGRPKKGTTHTPHASIINFDNQTGSVNSGHGAEERTASASMPARKEPVRGDTFTKAYTEDHPEEEWHYAGGGRYRRGSKPYLYQPAAGSPVQDDATTGSSVIQLGQSSQSPSAAQEPPANRRPYIYRPYIYDPSGIPSAMTGGDLQQRSVSRVPIGATHVAQAAPQNQKSPSGTPAAPSPAGTGTAVADRHGMAEPGEHNQQDVSAAKKTKRSYQKGGKQMIVDLVKRKGGVYPGHYELWDAFVSAWKERYGVPPDRQVMQRAIKSAHESGGVKRIIFAFRGKKGLNVDGKILVLPEIDVASPVVEDMKRRIIAAHPAQYIPEENTAYQNGTQDGEMATGSASGEYLPGTIQPKPKDHEQQNLGAVKPNRPLNDRFPVIEGLVVQRTSAAQELAKADERILGIGKNQPPKIRPRKATEIPTIADVRSGRFVPQGNDGGVGRLLSISGLQDPGARIRKPVRSVMHTKRSGNMGYLPSHLAHSQLLTNTVVSSTTINGAERKKTGPRPGMFPMSAAKRLDKGCWQQLIGTTQRLHAPSGTFGTYTHHPGLPKRRATKSVERQVKFQDQSQPQTLSDILAQSEQFGQSTASRWEPVEDRSNGNVDRVLTWEDYIASSDNTLSDSQDLPFTNHETNQSMKTPAPILEAVPPAPGAAFRLPPPSPFEAPSLATLLQGTFSAGQDVQIQQSAVVPLAPPPAPERPVVKGTPRKKQVEPFFDRAYVVQHEDEEFHHIGRVRYRRGPKPSRRLSSEIPLLQEAPDTFEKAYDQRHSDEEFHHVGNGKYKRGPKPPQRESEKSVRRASLAYQKSEMFDKAYVQQHPSEQFHHVGNGKYRSGPKPPRRLDDDDHVEPELVAYSAPSLAASSPSNTAQAPTPPSDIARDLPTPPPVADPQLVFAGGRKRPFKPRGPRKHKADADEDDEVMVHDEDGAAQVDLRPKKRKNQVWGRDRRSAATFNEEETLIRTIAMVGMLCGGITQSRFSWNLVAHAMNFTYESEFLRHRWEKYRKTRAQDVTRVQDTLREPFLRDYESGELPSIDFTKPEAINWSALMQWVEGQLTPLLRSQDDTGPKLPASREAFNATHLVVEGDELAEVDLQEFFISQTDMYLRQVTQTALHGIAFPDEERPSKIQNDSLILIKSWCRAVTMTPTEYYDDADAAQKLRQFPGLLLKQAITEMVESHIFSHAKKGRQLPGRNFHLSAATLKLFARWPDDDANYLRAVAKAWQNVRDLIQTQDRLQLTMHTKDPEMVVLTNLVAQGCLKIASILPARNDDFDAPFPKLTAWGYTDGNYNAKWVDKSRLTFPVVYEKTAMWEDTHGLRQVKIPMQPCSVAGEDLRRIPFWVDIHGNLIPHVWEMVLRSILHLVVFRPGITAIAVEKAHKGKLWLYEIEMVMQWMEQSGVSKRTGRGKEVDGVWKGGWITDDWWYCAFGADMVDWRTNGTAIEPAMAPSPAMAIDPSLGP